MALHVGLRRARSPAGIISHSGMLVADARFAAEIKNRPPVLLTHGAVDEVLPAACLPAAEAALKAVGVPVEAHLIPGLGHGIDEATLRLDLRFLDPLLSCRPVSAAPSRHRACGLTHQTYTHDMLEIRHQPVVRSRRSDGEDSKSMGTHDYPALVLNADFRPLSYFPLSLWSLAGGGEGGVPAPRQCAFRVRPQGALAQPGDGAAQRHRTEAVRAGRAPAGVHPLQRLPARPLRLPVLRRRHCRPSG